MSNQNSQEKTEKATQKRISDSKKRGHVLRSKDLSTTFILIISSGFIYLMAENSINKITGLMENYFGNFPDLIDVLNNKSHIMITQLIQEFSLLISPFLLIVLFASILSPLVLGGISLNFKSLKFKLDKLNPLSGFKRIVSMKVFLEILKSIIKFTLVLSVITIILYFFTGSGMDIYSGNVIFNIINSIDKLLFVVFLSSISLILILAIDLPIQFWEHSKKMKMTKQEIKDEVKETEGSPEVKSRVRSMQREIAKRRMMEDVKESDLLIVNPTHYSAAIKYDKKVNEAPVLMAKGVDNMALLIRKIAKEHKIPIVTAPVLARAIYYNTKIKQEIPVGLYTAVAQVLAYIYQLKKYYKGEVERPIIVKNFNIPKEFRTKGGKL